MKEICPHITVKEYVCPHVYNKYGDNAIKFINPNLINVLNCIRNEILCTPMDINNGTTLTQRGGRCNLCQLVATKTKANKLYLSGHQFFSACDFSCKKYTPAEIHELIKKNAHKLPCKIRLESIVDAPTWVHVDVMTYGQSQQVYVFRA